MGGGWWGGVGGGGGGVVEGGGGLVLGVSWVLVRPVTEWLLSFEWVELIEELLDDLPAGLVGIAMGEYIPSLIILNTITTDQR